MIDPKKLQKQKEINEQPSLFDNPAFRPSKPLEYRFKYEFYDSNNKKHNLMIEDWEIYELYQKMLKKYKSSEKALEKVREKYESFMTSEYDTYLFLGTRFEAHNKGYDNPFSIIGVFYPKRKEQGEFDFGE